MENTFIRLKDGLIVQPVYYENTNGERIINYNLYTYWNSEEPSITIDDLKTLGFIPIKDLINKPVETTNEQPEKFIRLAFDLLVENHYPYSDEWDLIESNIDRIKKIADKLKPDEI